MEINSFPNNKDEEQGAQDVMRWLHGRTSGVFGAQNNAAVKAAGGMNVSVTDGVGWITNADGDGVVWWNNSQKSNGNPVKLTLAAADTAMDRLDRIIVEWKTTSYADLPEIRVLQGNPAINALPPTLTNDAVIRQLSLANVRVKAGATSVNAADITDERLDKSVCGLVTEQVEVDTSVMQAQFLDLLQDTRDQTKAVLDAIEQELADLEAGTAVEMKKLLFRDTVASKSIFKADNTYQDYPYRAAVALPGVLESMVPDVALGMADATDGNIAPVAAAYNGGVYLYAGSIPENDITIPTIIVWRG